MKCLFWGAQDKRFFEQDKVKKWGHFLLVYIWSVFHKQSIVELQVLHFKLVLSSSFQKHRFFLFHLWCFVYVNLFLSFLSVCLSTFWIKNAICIFPHIEVIQSTIAKRKQCSDFRSSKICIITWLIFGMVKRVLTLFSVLQKWFLTLALKICTIASFFNLAHIRHVLFLLLYFTLKSRPLRAVSVWNQSIDELCNN